MDGHADGEEDEDRGIVGQDVGHLGKVPSRTDALDHHGGCVPGGLVGFGGVEIGAGAEEEAREGDEDKGDEDGPSGGDWGVERGEFFGAAHDIYYCETDEEDLEAEGQEVEEGTLGEVGGRGEEGGEEEEGEQAGGPGTVLPPLVYQDAESVEAAPGDEIERRAVPHAA